MPRTYSFDHFTATKPAATYRGKKKAPTHAKPPTAETPAAPQKKGEVHYGHTHAQTEALYQEHRQQKQRASRRKAAPPQPRREKPEALEALRDLTNRAVDELRKAMHEASESEALQRVRKLVDETISSARQLTQEALESRPVVGVRRMAREVSARETRLPIARQTKARPKAKPKAKASQPKKPSRKKKG